MILSIDSSSVTAAASLTDGDDIIKSEFVNSGLTHSETLLPMVKRVMGGRSYDDIEYIAVTTGPGSFTGVRIGVATVKGIAFANNIPCKSVSSLEAVAYNFLSTDCTVLVCMDARRMQFYNALFKVTDGVVTRLCPDRALSIDDLKGEVEAFDSVIVAGDGARLFVDNAELSNIHLCKAENQFIKGKGVALASRDKTAIEPAALVPVYLRPSQAERELKLKREINL